jgi:hypothetical protein
VGDSTTGGTSINEPYNVSQPASKYRIRLKYKTRVDFFRLDRYNIVRGSESVFVDGKRLRRDADYNFDFTSGYLSFQDPTLLRPGQRDRGDLRVFQIRGYGESNIFGSRLEYDLTDHLFLGSTFLYSGSQKPQDVPQIGSSPNSISLLDADARYDLTRGMIHSATSLVPGLGNLTLPLDTKFSAEIAKSFYSPNNYDMEGEKGVALVVNMEGIDNVISASINPANWIASSAPVPIHFLNGGTAYLAGPVAANNLGAFPKWRRSIRQKRRKSGEGGHLFQTTKNVNDKVPTMSLPYSALTSQRWAGVADRHLEGRRGRHRDQVPGNLDQGRWEGKMGGDRLRTISEDSTDSGMAMLKPGHDPKATSINCDTWDLKSIDEEGDPANPGTCDNGIKTYYMPRLPLATGTTSAFPIPDGFSGEGARRSKIHPAKKGAGNNLFDTKDINVTAISTPPTCTFLRDPDDQRLDRLAFGEDPHRHVLE